MRSALYSVPRVSLLWPTSSQQDAKLRLVFLSPNNVVELFSIRLPACRFNKQILKRIYGICISCDCFVHCDVLAVRAAELRVLERVNIALSLAFVSPLLVVNTATMLTLIAYTSNGNNLTPEQVINISILSSVVQSTELAYLSKSTSIDEIFYLSKSKSIP